MTTSILLILHQQLMPYISAEKAAVDDGMYFAKEDDRRAGQGSGDFWDYPEARSLILG